ncbi:carnitine dehydratase [Sphingobium sp. SCG-1]|uniref:CoA transferase n=1 Tax=Sphingobium sp. SCG-1 TaxID=2072936 RepID=UPI000CD68DE9|nr:CoA transferase [Sphingobium sp. SCG-1]AUW57104.1 carnitine dehydratase [Sphingobium sp. SCG-1]
MYDLLGTMRVVEASSFVAAPSAGLYLSQMGAEVIRIDQIGGGPDFKRWPLADNGASFYWEGLNKGKKSVALDLGNPEGRDLLAALITANGKEGGHFLTNFPVVGFLAHDKLAERRADLVTVRVMGKADGGPAFDYTVNCALGIPQITGPGPAPANHVLPAWDLLTGAYAAFAMLAGSRNRAAAGEGGEIRIPLADVGIATVANLGMLAEVQFSGADRERFGNDVYGVFGRDFVTRDGARLMIMAITPRQWSGLLKVLRITGDVARIEAELDVSFTSDEGLRFTHRNRLTPLVAAAVAQRDAGELSKQLDDAGCSWGPYKSMSEAIRDPQLVTENPVFAQIEQVSGFSYPVPGAMATLAGIDRRAPVRAPRLGEHTDDVFSNVLGLGSGSIGRLHDQGIIG